MGSKKKNLVYTLLANILTFVMGIVTGFVIPKFLGIDDYGYIKLFTFYITYVGIFHFGFLDGIYIKYGSYDYKDIPKEKFRGYFRYLVILQIVESVILYFILTNSVIGKERYIILLFVIFNMTLTNLTTFFAFIHQFTKRFKVFSINLVLQKLIYVIGALILIYLNILGYVPFIILQTIINIIILGIYVYINKEVVFGKSEKVQNIKEECFNITKSGFFIMIGNFTGVIILGMDRIFVDKFFTLEEFAIYSFCYTLISLFFILLNSLTTVIYPYLARNERNEDDYVYENIRFLLTVIMAITFVAYFAIKIVIMSFLPKYMSSLGVLIFLIPTVLYSAQINILIANYYKILKLTKEYTKNNIIALTIGILTNIVAIIFLKDIQAIAFATLISFMLWVLYSDITFKKILKIRIKRNFILDIICISLFILSTKMNNIGLGILLYIIGLALVISVFYKKDSIRSIKFLKEKSKN